MSAKETMEGLVSLEPVKIHLATTFVIVHMGTGLEIMHVLVSTVYMGTGLEIVHIMVNTIHIRDCVLCW